MSPHLKKLLVIITEASIEQQLATDIKSLGAHGYTVFEVRGSGSRGERNAEWDADRSIQFEVICDQATAAALAAHIQKTYFSNYAITLFTTTVEVLRSEKF